jgi:hypothetical protein
MPYRRPHKFPAHIYKELVAAPRKVSRFGHFVSKWSHSMADLCGFVNEKFHVFVGVSVNAMNRVSRVGKYNKTRSGLGSPLPEKTAEAAPDAALSPRPTA